jgi:hypothetical protein
MTMATVGGTKLIPGALGAETAQGKPAEFKGSMAEAIEDTLNALLPADRRFDVNDNSAETRDRRTLFVAIAQGVVKHLAANPGALEITHTTGAAATHKVEVKTEP